MKKLLTILSALTISMTGVTTVVACHSNTQKPSDQLSPEKVKDFLKLYQDEKNPFILSRDDGNQQNRLVKDIIQQLHLSSNYEVKVLEKDYEEPVLQGNTKAAMATVNNGTANLSLKYQGKEFWNDKIFWLTNELGTVKTNLEKLTSFTADNNGFVVPGQFTPDKIDSAIMTKALKTQFKSSFNFTVSKISARPSVKGATTKKSDDSIINYGTTTIDVKTSKGITVFSGEINWVTEPINTVADFVMELMGKGHSTNNGFDLQIPGLPIKLSLATLYDFVGMINTMMGHSINLVDLSSIGTDKFDQNWASFLAELDKNIMTIAKVSILDISLNKTIGEGKPSTSNPFVIIEGTVGDLLTNMAPSIIALLQWFISNDFKSNNVILELIQFLLSPVNSDVQNGIKNAWGEDELFFKNVKTNLDSLIGLAILGYKPDLAFNLKLNIGAVLPIIQGFLFGKDLPLVKGLELRPTKLIMSILNEFSTISKGGVDLLNQNILNKDNIKGILADVKNNLPEVTLKNFMGPLWNTVLPSLGLNANQLGQLNVELLQGRLKVMFKNQSDQWEEFQDVFKNTEDPNLDQILQAKDMKLQFTNLQFKLTSKHDPNATFTTNNDLTFEMLLSDKTV
ncbi:hypothetical protein SSYRP_v1c06000 [Spiroplasma syrphidicola EA-1]|uniref:Lipoprotein n=1 Tax=Spiroplasma syrphidicola EA-1 TaxID=1276229 RepID=R4UJ88_9MOLU|nr:lipoprotein [Spiroplasma syrphidicola]AGM26190.1 hypothetical protein SSYRP_v1c06000 [Spiroplasma syrphidicola EA-1]